MSEQADLPAQASLRRLRKFDVRPDRELGQNFLVDSNMLAVVSRAAEVEAGDVVLEVGGGLGVLSEHLAGLAGHVHVVEVDKRLRPALEDALAPFRNVTLHLTDAMALELERLEPPPDKVVANLPYGIAAPLLLETVRRMPRVRRWVAMVQKEVGQRLAAAPGSKAYGLPSVLAQLSCEVRVLRPVSRNVFHPVPNVDSVIVAMIRTGPPPSDELWRLATDAFAHRRKALARSVALASGRPGVRDELRRALAAAGLPEDARAERLTAEQFRALAERVAA